MLAVIAQNENQLSVEIHINGTTMKKYLNNVSTSVTVSYRIGEESWWSSSQPTPLSLCVQC